MHWKMALCRRKDGLGGHDEYVEERNAREILEYLKLKPQVEKGKAAEDAMTWIRQTKVHLRSALRIRKWIHRAKHSIGVQPEFSMQPEFSTST